MASLRPNIGNILKGIKSRDGRYVANKGTVTDSKTGLMWAQKGSYPDLGKCLDWNDSKSYVNNLNTGGHRDWRMPTISELKGIYEESKANNIAYDQDASTPLHLDKIFSDGAAYSYWSSETEGSCCARLIYFLNGFVNKINRDYCRLEGVRAVRRRD